MKTFIKKMEEYTHHEHIIYQAKIEFYYFNNA